MFSWLMISDDPSDTHYDKLTVYCAEILGFLMGLALAIILEFIQEFLF